MSDVDVIVEPAPKPASPRRAKKVWWLLAAVVVAVVVVAWPDSHQRDPKLIGQWTFQAADASNSRIFLTLNRDGTAKYQRVASGSDVLDNFLLTWWSEGDLLIAHHVVGLAARANQWMADTSSRIRGRQQEDRSAFRIKVVYLNENMIRLSDVKSAAPDIEMTRVENPKEF
ncbi:hypothetical protein AYO47_01355 [Planctomyces sp. SCGC AG-212-M04]|nr:hypothetical protein AYO47_01355 [Planctomyces sp. SCGC AG-212-M04]